MAVDASFWRSRRVFLTGHTGFKGTWLSLWLARMGAEVHGYALDPPTSPSLFEAANARAMLASDERGDIVDFDSLRTAIVQARPNIVFHMAAQPLVRESYADPLRTYAVNVMGTANLLECVRGLDCVKSVIVVTTDKCYENREWVWPYRESDALGGHDPYSSSKAGTEIVAAAYRSSFLSGKTRLATARAGNVIGGGDWARDRLLPDCVMAFRDTKPVTLRYPQAVRPWQHVMDPLQGYVMLAQALSGPAGGDFEGAWNFGPDPAGEATVSELAHGIAARWGNGAEVRVEQSAPILHEAAILRLDSTKARTRLGWRPFLPFEKCLSETVSWYKAWHDRQDVAAYTLAQIESIAGSMT